jgi:hypothetical protein
MRAGSNVTSTSQGSSTNAPLDTSTMKASDHGQNNNAAPAAIAKAKKRTHNRDVAIRKKFEKELTDFNSPPANQESRPRGSSGTPHGNVSRKRHSGYGYQQSPPQSMTRTPGAGDNMLIQVRAKPGTVAAMNPALPIILSENTLVTEVARTMAGRRVDAVLVTDDRGGGELKGIVTDKDLAFRCVAMDGMDASRVKVGQIMTRYPRNGTASGFLRRCRLWTNARFVDIVILYS